MRLRAVAAAGILLAASWVGVDAARVTAATPNDTDFGKQWGMSLIGGPEAWNTATGVSTTVAVVDSGVDLTHPDLASKLDPGLNFIGGASAQDDNGHGTHVAGIAAAVTNNAMGVAGAAPAARILPIKALDSGGGGSSSEISAAIRAAATAGAEAINLSLAGYAQGLTGASFVDACEDAWNLGSLCVVAAGNEFITGSGFAADHVLVVSAVDQNDNKPGYASGVGAAMWGISAPGGGDALFGPSDQRIWSTCLGGSYCYNAGTSMAAPHVSGAYAVMRSLGLSPQAAVDRLLATAKDIGSPGRDSTFGAGRLDLAAAVRGMTPVLDTTTTSSTSGGGGGGTTTTTSQDGTPSGSDPVTRLSGADRIDTAIAISRDRWGAADTNEVVVSRADSYADALAGTPLAVLKRGPLLLTGRDRLDSRTRAEIDRLLLDGEGTVHLLGGLVALGPDVEAELADAGYRTVRYAGADRFDTAIRIARDGMADPTTLFLADGTNYRDALVGGAAAPAAGAAVLLTFGTTMPERTRSYLSSRPGTRRYAIGGPAAVADPSATRVAGSDAPDTSRRVAETFFRDPVAAGVASQLDFPDALGGGAHAATNGGPLLLTGRDTLSPTVASYLSANRATITRGYLYGGLAALSENVRTEVQRSIS